MNIDKLRQLQVMYEEGDPNRNMYEADIKVLFNVLIEAMLAPESPPPTAQTPTDTPTKCRDEPAFPEVKLGQIWDYKGHLVMVSSLPAPGNRQRYSLIGLASGEGFSVYSTLLQLEFELKVSEAIRLSDSYTEYAQEYLFTYR